MPRPRHGFPFSLRRISIFDIAAALLLAVLFFLLISASYGLEDPLGAPDQLPTERATYWE